MRLVLVPFVILGISAAFLVHKGGMLGEKLAATGIIANSHEMNMFCHDRFGYIFRSRR